MSWKTYTVRINDQSSLGTILPNDVIEGIWNGTGAQGNYPALDNRNYLNVEIGGINGSAIYSANATIGTTTKDTVFTLLRVNGDLTINSGVTVTTPARKLGLAILVKGNCTINGTLDMTARGANHNGSSIAQILNPNSADSGFLNTYPGRIIRLFSGNLNLISLSGTTVTIGGDVSNISLPDQGSPGGSGSGAIGIDALSGSLATGGGAAGDALSGGIYGGTGIGGSGAAGSTFGGGTGGGGGYAFGTSVANGTAATPNGGRGGLGTASYGNFGGAISAGGGAGNPGGLGGFAFSNQSFTGNDSASQGQSGTGGLLILFVTGAITIGSNGKILSRGSNGGTISGNLVGGSSGGGVICIAANQYVLTTGYEISASGGTNAIRGGNGSVNLYRIGA